MKFIISFLVLLSPIVYSAPYSGSGKIEDILIRGSLDAFAIIYMNGFSSAGGCQKHGSKDLVILSVKNDEHAQSMYSMALAAYMADKSIKIVVDDSRTDSNGFCVIKDIRLNPRF
ncbi:hypothetical protein [Marinagarivorans algicola]|uniref:hypothetical protein n=1 Tax=Marinagarivorans algicola TaxID=1513270 RepID=UPI0006B97F1A|nr:hypothetical protein [Marinagarivorans algicola]